MLVCCCMFTVNAQTVTGKITDEFNEPVVGANVIEKGTTNGTVTNLEGTYTLKVANLRSSSLLVSFIGYVTKEVKIEGKTSLDVQLDPSTVNLDEVVAIGYGTQTRREITGSIANVSEKDFNQGFTRDATDLLQGKVAGLVITSGSGDVSRSSQVRLRGTSTLMNDQGPMIVIDGIPGGDLSTVAPNDIESISVLKDASSQAIYGSRAAGGVILVTTKRGKGNHAEVTYNGYETFDFVANKPHLLNAQEWIAANKQLGNDISVYQDFINQGIDTDWLGEMMRVGVSSNHNISIAGGTTNGNYRASYTLFDRKGVVRDNYMQRHMLRLQIQQRFLNDKLRLSITASANMGKFRRPFTDNFVEAYNLPPVVPVYNADGSWYTGAHGNYDQGNPIQSQALDYNKYTGDYMYGDGELQYNVIDGLAAKVHLYKSKYNNSRSQWLDPTSSRGNDDNGSAIRQHQAGSRDLMEWTLSYDKEFGKNKLSAIAGYSWEDNQFYGQYSYVTNFDVTYMGANAIQAGNDLKLGNVTSYSNSYKLISFYARAHYAFDERYMITATLRRDGSSKFGENHKWGMFPSVSAAWGIKQEGFAKDASWLDDLKFRVGYGITGNQDGLQPYKSLELYGTSGTYVSGDATLVAFKLTQNPNPDLKWEETSMLNIGVDYGFLGKFSGTIEWYQKNTSDMIYRYVMPQPVYVYDRMFANVGNMRNTGIEFSLNYDVVRNKTFKYTTSVNLAHNKNEVTKLSSALYKSDEIFTGDPWIRGQSDVTSHIVKVGLPVGAFYMWKVKSKELNAEGGFDYEDVNGDGQMTNDDRQYVGSAQPDLTFGWNNQFNWKNWDASFFLRGTIGNKVLNNPIAAYGNNTFLSGANAIENDNLLKYKTASTVSDFFLEDASFARLDNAAIGYSFNMKNVKGIEKLRLYATVQNLFVITKYTGIDPEVEIFRGEASDDDAGLSPGIEPRTYFPKSRSFTFGINLTF
ncbi:MAG: SusC/RagA family TonB-linked outer membrane protein [Bacteroidales bacterium]